MANGKEADDPAILNRDVLWRRIRPDWKVYDERLGRVRPSSAAFDDSEDGTPLSVQLEKIVLADGQDAPSVMARFPGYFLASITAGDARSHQQVVYPSPEPEDRAHASVRGKKTKSVKNALARAAQWVILSPESATKGQGEVF